VRYEITTWIGSGSEAQVDQKWKCWGRGKAQKIAQEVIEEYKARGVPDFEVMIFTGGTPPRSEWFFSAEQERQGYPPVTGDDLREQFPA
jgi:hypothetical protein